MTEDSKIFDDTPENLHNLPIVRGPNPFNPEKLDHDDAGFRVNCRVEECGEPIEELPPHKNLVPRSNYDGFHETDGKFDPAAVLPHGLGDGKMYGRRSLIQGLLQLGDYLGSRYGDGVQLAVLDTLRFRPRQSYLFGRAGREVLEGNLRPDLKTFYEAGLRADGTSSLVRPSEFTEADRKMLATVVGDIKGSPELYKDIQRLAEEVKGNVDEVLEELIIINANVTASNPDFKPEDRIVTPFTPLNLRLSSHVMGHSTGSCGDLYLLVDGFPVNLEPFDHVGVEASIEWYENPANFAIFQRTAATNPRIQEYLRRIGVDPFNIPFSRWQLAQQGVRILTHGLTRMGFTYYSASVAAEGGEKWHGNSSNIVRSIIDPQVIVYRGFAADAHPNSGSACHARLRVAPGSDGKQVAIYGGDFAHAQFGVSM